MRRARGRKKQASFRDDDIRINEIKRSTSSKGTASSPVKKKKKKKNVHLARLRAVILILLAIAIVVGLSIGSGMYAAISKEIDNMDFDSITNNYSTTIYSSDKKGSYIELTHLYSGDNREWVDSDKIPDIAKEAAISIEDERFYKHNGVDFKRTIGATFWFAVSKVTKKSPSYGGSTITQQLIKNITNQKDKTATRKIKEMMRAIALERHFSKDEILTMYLNIAYFGNRCSGIESASKVYFSKKASDLTLPEAALIVGITQAPTRFNPYTNPDNATAKRNLVLSKMYKLNKISEEEYNDAINAPLGVKKTKSSPYSPVYSYFVDQVITDVTSALQKEKGYSRDFAEQQVKSGGYKIYTTIDPDIQAAVDSVYQDKSNFPGVSNGTQSAMLILDPYTGEIKAMYGGIGKKTENRVLNRATQSTRQPGSSIKPLAAYSVALETNKITAASILEDSKLTVGDWTPKNSYSGYKGDMSVRKAIEISANIPAVKVLNSAGIETSYKYLTKKYHLSTLVDDDKNLSSLGLGGLTKGVTVKDMAAAYGVFANGGVYVTPHTYTKVLDSTGKVLLEYSPKSNRVISEANAFIMTSFLSEVVNGSAGTGRRAKLANMPTYGKTGTTNSNHDKWFVGFTPYYVGAVWYGYDKKAQGVSTNACIPVWNKVMTKVHQNLEAKEFEKPSNVEELQICQRTGKLASKGCKYAKTEYFVKGTAPTKYCNNASGNYHSGSSGNKTNTNKTDKTETTDTENTEDDGESENENSDSAPVQQEKPPTPSQNNTTPSQNQSEGSNVINLD